MNNALVINDAKELEQIRELFSYSVVSTLLPQVTAIPDDSLKALVQPKNVTYQMMSKNEVTEDIITEITRGLQQYMTMDPEKCYGPHNTGRCLVKVDFARISGFHRSRKDIEAAFAALRSSYVKFTWTQKGFVDQYGNARKDKQFIHEEIMFLGFTRSKEGYDYYVHVNPMTLPYLTFMGKGIGYTQIDYDFYQSLSSFYVKRFYKILSDWAMTASSRTISIADFREMIAVSDSFNITQVRMRVLDAMQKALAESNVGFRFEYKFFYDPALDAEGKKTKKGSNSIQFIFSYLSKKDQKKQSMKLQAIRNCLSVIADPEKKDSIDGAVKYVVAKGDADFLYNKFRYYTEMVRMGALTEKKMKNVLLKLMRERYDIDLRSKSHTENAARKKMRERKATQPSA